jgi:hypothetical protein
MRHSTLVCRDIRGSGADLSRWHHLKGRAGAGMSMLRRYVSRDSLGIFADTEQ